MSLEEYIFCYAKENQLEAGITTAQPFLECRPYLIEKESFLQEFVPYSIEERVNPKSTMPEAESILVLAMGYGKKLPPVSEGLRGRFSQGAIGMDYHLELKMHLKRLARLLQRESPAFSYQIFVDTGPLIDREVAKRAGIGYLGKNGALHTKGLGSMVFLGYMLTNLSLSPCKQQIQNTCNTCHRCIDACPTGALSEKRFQGEKCISYLTQKKGVLALKERKAMGLQIYGCDICQQICPHNQYIPRKPCSVKEYAPLLQELLEMNNRQFKQTIATTAAGWRGKKILQRNAIIALGNTKQKDALPLLAKAFQDERPLIKQTAAQSIRLFSIPSWNVWLAEQEKKEREHYGILEH